MKAIKRISALLLAAVMVFSLLPVFSEVYAFEMNEQFSKFTMYFDPGSGAGTIGQSGRMDAYTDDEHKKPNSVLLPDASNLGFAYNGYYFSGWRIGGKTYAAGAAYTFSTSDASKTSDDQYAVYATAQWTKNGTSTSSSTSTEYINGTYRPGDKATGSAYARQYKKGEEFVLDQCNFTREGYTFAGWEIEGTVYPAGIKATSASDFIATATWKATGIHIGEDSSSTSSTSSKPASSKPASSKPASSKPASSKPASSKPASSKPASSKPASSSSSSSVAESSVSSSASSSVPETPVTPEVPEFTPVVLSYSISGDIPVTGIEFTLKEDLGGKASLAVSVLDKYSAADDVTSKFIADGDTIAAFDISALVDGAAYKGSCEGTIKYILNGTQANAASNYKESVAALVHVIERSKFTGSSYYMQEDGKAYLYNVETGSKSEVGNISFAESDGVFRPVIGDVNSLSAFAYLANEDIIVEAKLMPDINASEVSIDISSFSPVMLVKMEMGKAAAASSGIPVWAIILIVAIVLVIAAIIVLFFVLRNNGGKGGRKSAPTVERRVVHHQSSKVTGFDDDSF